MLSNTLVTNEVKNSSGVEVEFERIQTNGRSTEFAQKSESPAAPHRIKISHLESGKGLNQRRRSVVRVDKTVTSTVDNETPVTVSAYLVLDAPVGALTSMAEPTNALAEILSFCASQGATTTILYDGTGNGAAALLNGTL